MYWIVYLAGLALLIFALVDLITSDNWQVKHLPKITWVFIIIFLPLIGSLIWLLAGKERAPLSQGWSSLGDVSHEKTATTSTTEQELEALEREIAFHENQEKIKRLEAELEAKRRGRSQQ